MAVPIRRITLTKTVQERDIAGYSEEGTFYPKTNEGKAKISTSIHWQKTVGSLELWNKTTTIVRTLVAADILRINDLKLQSMESLEKLWIPKHTLSRIEEILKFQDTIFRWFREE